MKHKSINYYPCFFFPQVTIQLSFASKRKLQRKLPHRLALAEFLILLTKIYTLAASYDKFLDARKLKFGNALRNVREFK